MGEAVMRRNWLRFAAAVLCLAVLMAAVPSGSAEAARKKSRKLRDTADRSSFTGTAVAADLPDLEIMSSSETEELGEVMASYVPAERQVLVNEAPEFYYYEQLDPLAKQICDVMLGIANDPVMENIGLLMTDIDPRTDRFSQAFCDAFFALGFDHPELYWLYYGAQDYYFNYASDVVVKNGIYVVYFQLNRPYEDFRTDTALFNRAAAKFLKDIDTDASEYEIARQIHDKLIGMVAYNHEVEQAQDGKNLAHTAFGALVEDSDGSPNLPVCDGYSLAYEYLLQQCGIEAVYIGGYGGSSRSNAGGHAWNMVKLDGEWYEVDSTWDDNYGDYAEMSDPESDPYYDLVLEALSDEDFREKIEHYLFLVSTETMTEYIPNEEDFVYYYRDRSSLGGFRGRCVHFRDTNENDEFDYPGGGYAIASLMDRAPVAEEDYGE